ncbi:MAG: V-type ATPase subunit [Treponema sp.]|nr:V-type ATPase subunit [Treponema sp.]MBQ4235843.1 V-type ATPase subunit [Treponema sp.]
MAMDKAAADAYIYARTSGILAKSFVGERVRALFSVHSLQELWSLVIKTDVPAVPETLLAKELEKAAQTDFISQFKNLLCTYSRPSGILTALLHYYDYDNLKEIGAALCYNERTMPDVVDTSPYSLIDYAKWPDISAMTSKGPLSWYDTVPTVEEQQSDDYRLDCQYVRELISSLKHEKASYAVDLENLFIDKYQVENVLWALRLRIFYGMDDDEIKNHLAYESVTNGSDRLAKEAVKILSWPVDDYEHWKKWGRAKLLNPYSDGELWTVDPRWIANAYNRYFVGKAMRLFHQYPLTVCPLVCWYIIKQHELENIRTASECIRLNASSDDALVVAGLSEVNNG